MKNLLGAFVFICVTPSAIADQDQFKALDLRFEGSAYYGNDSAVGITEIDQLSLESDSEIRWTINPTAQWAFDNKTALLAGYNRTLSQYQTLDDYDTDIADLNLGLKREWSWADTSYRFDHVTASVAGDDFLTLKMHTVDAGKLFNDRVYTRAALVTKQKRFEVLSERDASASGLNAQCFIFSKDYINTVIIAASLEQENATTDYYSKDVMQLSLAWGHKTQLFTYNTKIKFSGRYSISDYQAFNPNLEAVREDTLFDLVLESKVSITANVFASAEALYSDQQSNDASADYSRSILRIGVGVILD